MFRVGSEAGLDTQEMRMEREDEENAEEGGRHALQVFYAQVEPATWGGPSLA
jgi:hypothetical protein